MYGIFMHYMVIKKLETKCKKYFQVKKSLLGEYEAYIYRKYIFVKYVWQFWAMKH